MSAKRPQPTAVLVKRLQRVGRWIEDHVDPDSADHDEETRAAIHARANTCWQAAARLEQSSDLLAALKAVTEGMDMAGGDGYGMSECPWCHKDDFNAEHRSDCELLAARAAIAKADGRQP